MKNIFFIITVIVCCTMNATAQYGPCPGGLPAIGVSFEFTQFNFHKPRTNCTTGFGICIRGYLRPLCPTMKQPMVELTPEGIVKGRGEFTDQKQQKLTLYFPEALKYQSGFLGSDMGSFEVGEDFLFITDENDKIVGKVVAKNYPVIERNGFLIVEVDIRITGGK